MLHTHALACTHTLTHTVACMHAYTHAHALACMLICTCIHPTPHHTPHHTTPYNPPSPHSTDTHMCTHTQMLVVYVHIWFSFLASAYFYLFIYLHIIIVVVHVQAISWWANITYHDKKINNVKNIIWYFSGIILFIYNLKFLVMLLQIFYHTGCQFQFNSVNINNIY